MAAHAIGRIEIVRQPVAGPIGGSNQVLELVDGFGRKITRIEDADHVETGVDGGGEIADDAAAGPFATERGHQIGDGVAQPLVGRERRRLGEQPEPGGEFAAAAGRLAKLESLRQRRLERVAQGRRIGGAVAPQQKRQHVRTERGSPVDRVDHAIGNPLQLRQRLGLQP